MKKVLSAIVFLILTLSVFSACGNNENSDQNDGKQPLCLSKSVLKYTNIEVVEETRYYYNGLGQLSEKVTYRNGVESSSEEFGYDESGFLIYKKRVSSMEVELFYTNDSEGKPVEIKQMLTVSGEATEIITKISYIDDNGSYIESTADVEGKITEVTYLNDAHGNLSEIKYTQGSVKYFNIYDSEGRLTEQTNDMQTPSWLIKIEYDENGNRKKESNFDPTEELIYYTEYFYSAEPPVR